MSKPNEEELEVDFFNEVEDVVDEEQALEEETDESEEEESEEVEGDDPDETDDEVGEGEEDDDPDGESDSDPEDESVVGLIKQRLGYEFEEEFEDTEEGIQLLVEAASKKRAEEVMNVYFEEYPDVKELLEYRRLGGDPDKFFETKFPEVDYSKVELREDDTSQQEQVILHELQSVRGYTKEEAKAELEDYKNGGILESKAKRALNALKVKQQQDQESLVEEQQKQREAQIQEQEEYKESVVKTIEESTAFNNIKLPSKDKQAFIDYLFKPVKDGKSQAMLNAEQASLEKRLAIDLLLFKDFDLGSLVDRKAKDKNAKTLKERMRKAKMNKQTEKSSETYTEELDVI